MEQKEKKKSPKIDFHVKKVSCFLKTDLSPEEQGYNFHFVESGYGGVWIKVFECHDYTVGASYASEEENRLLNMEKEKS